MINPLLAILVNHLWQSTLFALGIAALVVLLQKNSARARYWLWLAASLKFLVPFAALAAIGTQIPWPADAGSQIAAAPRIVELAGNFTVPLEGDVSFLVPWTGVQRDSSILVFTVVLLSVWITGMLFVAGRWLVRWFEICLARWRSRPVANIDFPTRVRVTSTQLEPGIVGIIRPVLLLPEGIDERLTPEQMRAVLAHERCHLRRRDNLTASLHMLVEMLFWFFPPVWWIGARLIEEREQACDEEVIRSGCAPQSYAEGILAVCEHYIASRLPCVSGVSGADLRKRIEGILRNTLSMRLNPGRKLALAGFACCALSAPIAAGMASGATWRVLLSLNPEGAASLQYLQLAGASAETQWFGRSGSNCPNPNLGPRVVEEQKILGATVRKLSPWDDRALLFAVGANSTMDVQRLLDGGAPRKADGFFLSDSIMHVAAEFGDVRMLDMLYDAGFSIEGRIHRGALPAFYATPLIVAIKSGRRENVDWFIQHGASFGAATNNGTSALAYALTICPDQKLITRLLRAGARPKQGEIRLANGKGIDLSGDQPWHAAPESRALHADLDDDGANDRAELRMSADGKRAGVFATLSSGTAGKWIQIAEDRSFDSATGTSTGISVAVPGNYRTECSWAYHRRRCKEGEIADLALKQPGIQFIGRNGAASIIVWNKPVGRFERLEMRD